VSYYTCDNKSENQKLYLNLTFDSIYFRISFDKKKQIYKEITRKFPDFEKFLSLVFRFSLKNLNYYIELSNIIPFSSDSFKEIILVINNI
jgi:hypothetical protein